MKLIMSATGCTTASITMLSVTTELSVAIKGRRVRLDERTEVVQQHASIVAPTGHAPYDLSFSEARATRTTYGRTSENSVAPNAISIGMQAYYGASIGAFLDSSPALILGEIVEGSHHNIEATQRAAWQEEVRLLQETLGPYRGCGKIFFEFSVPRLGKRIDVVVLLHEVIFVLEFKVGEAYFTRAAVDQVWDYALDLKNFHETSRERRVVPVLIGTAAEAVYLQFRESARGDGVLDPIRAAAHQLAQVFRDGLATTDASVPASEPWEHGRYSPTPTIVEAATALYSKHRVDEITRSDADAVNLRNTSEAIASIIASARNSHSKAICFVTGVPGAGKTLVGLDIATRYAEEGQLHSVFLSGNGPLVSVLREALARDSVARKAEDGKRVTKKEALGPVQAFIQNVHHFRDAYLKDPRPPVDHIAVFDEAQRAWNHQQTANFMQRKRGHSNFAMSEPEYLISCLDRHQDWAVIVCLVGGGQEINTGEGGIGEWITALTQRFPQWQVHISPHLHDSEYGSGEALRALAGRAHVVRNPELHLAVSMRSFRAENVSALVKCLLDRDTVSARSNLTRLHSKYPILLTRDLSKAKEWLRSQARGNERYGVVVSSHAERLKPHAIDVRSPMDPIHWFLHDKSDVRSSYYMEDVATEFHVQGLELDWTCVVWDADLRYSDTGWQHFSFAGTKWNRIRAPERQLYLKNAYRVLLTRARQGMIVVVPDGDPTDPTRSPDYYDTTYRYLVEAGVPLL
jgi:hypothetical protein